MSCKPVIKSFICFCLQIQRDCTVLNSLCPKKHRRWVPSWSDVLTLWAVAYISGSDISSRHIFWQHICQNEVWGVQVYNWKIFKINSTRKYTVWSDSGSSKYFIFLWKKKPMWRWKTCNTVVLNSIFNIKKDNNLNVSYSFSFFYQHCNMKSYLQVRNKIIIGNEMNEQKVIWINPKYWEINQGNLAS